LAELAEQHDLAVISDECYGRLVYDGSKSAPSIAAIGKLIDRTIVVDSFSKTYAMTGWRLGFALAPARLTRTLQRFAVNGHSCTPGFVQRAGVAAITGTQGPLARIRGELAGRRDVVVAALNALPGVSCIAPVGAFYAFADISRAAARVGRSTQQYMDWLLDSIGVAGIAGTAFGARGDGHIRFSFAAPTDQIALAIERLYGALPRGAR
jgi:aspartate aminotransferase